MREVCTDRKAQLVGFNGELHHTRLLIEYLPKVTVAELVSSLNWMSTRCLRDEYPGWVNRHSMNGHFWSPCYFAASCYGAAQQRPPRSP